MGRSGDLHLHAFDAQSAKIVCVPLRRAYRLSSIGVYSSDVPYFYRLLTKLNDTVHRAAQDSRVVTFVSPDLFFAGHDVCSKSSYIFPLTALDPRALHPNAEGHAQLASLLRRAAGPPPD
jgi:hypothetical protein